MKRIAVLLFGATLAIWSTGCCCLSHLCGYGGGGCNPCATGYGPSYGGGYAPAYGGGSPCGPGGCGVNGPMIAPQGAYYGGFDATQACAPVGGPMGMAAMAPPGGGMAVGMTPYAPGQMTASMPMPVGHMPGGPVPHTHMAGPVETLPTY